MEKERCIKFLKIFKNLKGIFYAKYKKIGLMNSYFII